MIRGSALRALEAAEAESLDDAAIAPIDALVSALDAHVECPVRDLDAPFLMPIENVHTIEGRGTDVTGLIAAILNGEEYVVPGQRASVEFDLDKPVGLEVGMRFAVREGGKTVGAGVVTAVG